MSISQSILLPALRWYSCAVVSSSAADDVCVATEVMLDSMLSAAQAQNEAHVPSQFSQAATIKAKEDMERTEHASLLNDECAEITEDLVQLVDPRLDLADLDFPLGNLGLLELELVCRDRSARS